MHYDKHCEVFLGVGKCGLIETSSKSVSIKVVPTIPLFSFKIYDLALKEEIRTFNRSSRGRLSEFTAMHGERTNPSIVCSILHLHVMTAER